MEKVKYFIFGVFMVMLIAITAGVLLLVMSEDSRTTETEQAPVPLIRSISKSLTSLWRDRSDALKPPSLCPVMSFTFPGRDRKNFVKYRGEVPRLSSWHVCAWVRWEIAAERQFRTVASYKTGTYHDAFLWSISAGPSDDRTSIGLASSYYHFQPKPAANDSAFVCYSHDESSNRIYETVNGVPHSEIALPPGQEGTLAGGGNLTLGQDEEEKEFDIDWSFSGTITNFIMWPRTLSVDEIELIVYQCLCPPDHVVHFDKIKSAAYGDVTYDANHVCPFLRKKAIDHRGFGSYSVTRGEKYN